MVSSWEKDQPDEYSAAKTPHADGLNEKYWVGMTSQMKIRLLPVQSP